MYPWKIGLASVTFRNKSIEEIVCLCKKVGIGFVEWGADVHVKSAADARLAKKLCDEAGIAIPSYGSYYRVGSRNDAEWLALCENASIMGAKSIRIWLGEKNSEDTSEEEYENLLADLRSICEKAESYGLLVCPECHDNTFNNNTDAILRFISDLQKDNFRTYFQSRYFRMAYDLDRIDRTYDYIRDFHVSYRDLKREQLFRKKDKNYLDKLLRKFKDKNFDGIVMVEFVSYNSEKRLYKDTEKIKSI